MKRVSIAGLFWLLSYSIFAQHPLRADSFPVSILNEIVVTGTKTLKRKTETPVIVNILTAKTLNNVQACNLSEGLKFQPGLRIETNCQTCSTL